MYIKLKKKNFENSNNSAVVMSTLSGKKLIKLDKFDTLLPVNVQYALEMIHLNSCYSVLAFADFVVENSALLFIIIIYLHL